jgi:hypothetical protein
MWSGETLAFHCVPGTKQRSIAECSIETDEAARISLLRLPNVVQVSAILNSPR